MHLSRDDRGISAVQTMLVIVIIGVLAYFALPVWNQLVLRAQAKSCQQNQRNIDDAIALARTDNVAPNRAGYYDSVLDAGIGWGKYLIPNYLQKAPRCPSEGGGLYNLSPSGQIWSDRGVGQYIWINQGVANDHRLGH